MWRFHRYYIKEFLLNLGLTFVMLFGTCLLALVARGIYRSQGVDLVIGLWITLLWGVDVVPHLLAISALVASVFTFGRAAADNEIIAMRMTGTSPLRLMGAVLFVGALTATCNAWLLHETIPRVHYLKYRPSKDLLTQLLINNRSRQNKWELSRLTMMWARKEGQRYFDVDFNTRAREGHYIGHADEVAIESDFTGEMLFISAINFRGEREVGEGHVHFKSAELEMSFNLRDILEKGKRHEGMKDLSTTQLVTEVRSGGAERAEEASWYVWLRSCQALAALLFAIVGFPIGVIWRRAGRMVSFAVSFLPLSLYYGLTYVAAWIARSTGDVWPVVLPDLGLFLAGYLLSRRAFRQ